MAFATREQRGIRTRVLLIATTAIIIASATFVSMFTIRRQLQEVVMANLSADLVHSIATFEDVEAQRMSALDRENALLADLPSLKALMTTSDQRTIEDGAVEFWQVGGNDLFALADRDGHLLAAYAGDVPAAATLRTDLEPMLRESPRPYVISGGRLIACSVQPIYFGSQKDGTILGYVISGFSIDRSTVGELSRSTGVEAIFKTGEHTLASSLATSSTQSPADIRLPRSQYNPVPSTVTIQGERYLAVSRDLSDKATAPLELVELKSLDQEERSIRQINRLVLLAGLVALLLGTGLMTALSRFVTRPLEELDAGVRAFAAGDSSHLLPYRGTMEVRELSAAFAGMRREIILTNQALLESERLATIGRMASSVSHDLRHYLAAIYANSEFLASGRLSDEERTDILNEIRSAVDGTTELLESLLIFSRSGPGIRRSHQLVATLVDRAVALIRSHPDAAKVDISLRNHNPAETAAVVDGKQIERAIYNLLLNACQAVRSGDVPARVAVTVDVRQADIILEVLDNGDGVSEQIRSTLFEPFVSEGKQKGSGLGLTLAQCIAREHGGDVILLTSRPGETTFRLSISRGFIEAPVATADDRTRVRTV
jgi:signal transduction histidine kinase